MNPVELPPREASTGLGLSRYEYEFPSLRELYSSGLVSSYRFSQLVFSCLSVLQLNTSAQVYKRQVRAFLSLQDGNLQGWKSTRSESYQNGPDYVASRARSGGTHHCCRWAIVKRIVEGFRPLTIVDDRGFQVLRKSGSCQQELAVARDLQAIPESTQGRRLQS